MRQLFYFLWLAILMPLHAEEIMPLSEIKPGMHGIVYTVLQGTTIVPLQTEILGVAENSIGPGFSLIIGKLVDPKTELIEAVHGMSGSPLYIDGKLAGALSRQLTLFQKDGQCGFTPIADMLKVDDLATSEPKDVALETRPFSPTSFAFAKKNGLPMATFPAPSFQTLSVPLSITGLSEQAVKELLAAFHLDDGGLMPISAGSGSTTASKLGDADLKPGSAVSAVLMEGDVNVVGTGTVTWRTGNRILAFGHPMMNLGRSALGMAPAEIVTTVPSYYEPFKLSNPGPIVGTVVEDRFSAIGGVVGQKPPMADYEIEREDNGIALAPVRGRFVLEPTLAPLMVAVAVRGAARSTNEAGRKLFLRAEGEIDFQDLPPLQIHGVYSGTQAEIAEALTNLVEPLKLLYVQDWKKPVARSVKLKLTSEEQERVWTIEDAHLDKNRYLPGALVDVDVSLRERFGAREERHFALQLPPNLKSGPLHIRVSDASQLDNDKLTQTIPALTDAAQLIDLFNRRRTQDRIYVQLVSDASGQIVGDKEMPSLPPSVLSVMDKANRGEAPVALHEQVWSETSQPLPGVVSGQETLSFDIHS